MLGSLDRMQGDLGEYAAGIKGHVRIHANISAIVEFLRDHRLAAAHKDRNSLLLSWASIQVLPGKVLIRQDSRVWKPDQAEPYRLV